MCYRSHKLRLISTTVNISETLKIIIVIIIIIYSNFPHKKKIQLAPYIPVDRSFYRLGAFKMTFTIFLYNIQQAADSICAHESKLKHRSNQLKHFAHPFPPQWRTHLLAIPYSLKKCLTVISGAFSLAIFAPWTTQCSWPAHAIPAVLLATSLTTHPLNRTCILYSANDIIHTAAVSLRNIFTCDNIAKLFRSLTLVCCMYYNTNCGWGKFRWKPAPSDKQP